MKTLILILNFVKTSYGYLVLLDQSTSVPGERFYSELPRTTITRD